jgi:hypothetical protein
MDPGRPKNQSSQESDETSAIACLSRRVDSGHIIFFANGRRMRKISRSDRFPKQAKKSTGQSQQVVLLTSAVRQVTSA